MKNFFIILLFSCYLFSQPDSTGTVKGRVLDADNQLPLAGANITIKSTTIGTVSDEKGYFTIDNILMGDYTVPAS